MSEITLIEKIKQDSAAKVAEIKAAGAAEVENIKRETELELKALAEAHSAALQKKQAHLELVAVAQAKQSGNIAVQQTKRSLIDDIFSEVQKEIEEQSTDEYFSFFKKYAEEAVPKGVDVKVVHAPTARQEETKKIIESLGFGGEIEEDNSMKAGLVLESDDGVYDVTLERIMGEKRAELEMNVVKEVMG